MRKFVGVLPHKDALTEEMFLEGGYTKEQANDYLTDYPRYWGLQIITEDDVHKWVQGVYDGMRENGEPELFPEMFFNDEEKYKDATPDDVPLERALYCMTFIMSADPFYSNRPTWIEITDQ